VNDNIRSIWNRAASSHQQAATSRETQENFLNRFAELIVKECVLISRTSTDGFTAGRRMKEHFGVEE